MSRSYNKEAHGPSPLGEGPGARLLLSPFFSPTQFGGFLFFL